MLFILVFALGLGIFPTTAQYPDGAGVFTQFKYLLLPALCLVCVLFGYIARMARAGTIEALEADYTRTAVLKGLPQRTVVRRHVLRNALLPTIAVVATQAGYLIGGLVVIELIFNYQGIGQTLIRAANQKDIPVLQSAVLLIGVVYLVATLIADILLLRPEPARPAGSRGVSSPPQPPSAAATDVGPSGAVALAAAGDDARVATRERLALLRRSKSFIAGSIIVGFWIVLRDLRPAAGAAGPAGLRPDQRPARPVGGQLVRHGQAGPGRLRARHRGCARHPDRRARGDDPRHGRSAPPSASSRGTSAASSTTCSAASSRPSWPSRVIIAGVLVAVAVGPSRLDADPDHRPPLRADHLAHGARRRVDGERARVRFRRAPAQRGHALHPVRRDPAQRDRADHRGVHRPARLRHLHRRRALLPRLRHPAAGAGLGRAGLRATTA